MWEKCSTPIPVKMNKNTFNLTLSMVGVGEERRFITSNFSIITIITVDDKKSTEEEAGKMMFSASNFIRWFPRDVFPDPLFDFHLENFRLNFCSQIIW